MSNDLSILNMAEPGLACRLWSNWVRQADAALRGVGAEASDEDWIRALDAVDHAADLLPAPKLGAVAAKARDMIGDHPDKVARRRLAMRAFRTAACLSYAEASKAA
ncbi:hypothetical protein [Parvularcula oceani]|uniref:hypothetical protein n=1 Tax=Parvularcula oceani TaxID=1247963 RepID=UPI0004E14120|nr:hypothetical protein [Parvularcula oceani]